MGSKDKIKNGAGGWGWGCWRESGGFQLEICRLQCVSLLPVALSSHTAKSSVRDKRATVGVGKVGGGKGKRKKKVKNSCEGERGNRSVFNSQSI